VSGRAEAPRYARFAWVVVLLGVAAITVGSQLDFATRTRPEIAVLVPEPFRAHAYAPLAKAALKANRGEDARRLAQALIRQRPIPAESGTMLAIAAQMLDNPELASRALTTSASRGWRDPVAQTAVVYAALYAQDWQMLLERFDALYRTRNSQLVPSYILNDMLSTDGGQRAFAKRLSEDRNWLARFLNMGLRGDINSEALVKTMDDVHTLEGEPDCLQLVTVARKLLSHGEATAADGVWGGRCEMNANVPITGFRPPSDTSSFGPLEWTFPSSPGLGRSFKIHKGIGVLDYRHSDALRAVLAERFLTLPAGTHTIQLGPNVALEGSLIFFRIECIGGGSPMIQASQIQGTQKFAVPSDCPVQRLALSVTKGMGKGLRVIID